MLFQITLSEEQTNLDAFSYGDYQLPSYNNDCETIEDSKLESEITSFFESLHSYVDLTSFPKSILAQLEGKRIHVYAEDKFYRDGGRFSFSVLNGMASICRYYINSDKDDAYEYTWLFTNKDEYTKALSQVDAALEAESFSELDRAVYKLHQDGVQLERILNFIKEQYEQ